jgi:hypothetical protein
VTTPKQQTTQGAKDERRRFSWSVIAYANILLRFLHLARQTKREHT